MKILIISIGTRGDIEPFLAVGRILKTFGHEVYCAIPEQYGYLAQEIGLEFRSLGPEFLDIVNDPDGRRVLSNEGNWIQYLLSLFRHFKKHIRNGENLLRRQAAFVEEINPDRIVHSGLASYPVLWEMENRHKSILILPIPYIIFPTPERSHVIFNVDWGPVFNRFSYKIQNLILAREIKKSARILQLPLHLSEKALMRRFLEYKTIFTVSPTLVPPLDYPQVRTLGFYASLRDPDWKPPINLLHFIERHEKILFITFGSMASNHPEKTTTLITRLLQDHNIPAIINTAAGGLTELTEYDHALIHFTHTVPYEWILPKMYAIIHHGGSGTTHSGLRHGCPTLILPHLFDQKMWNRTIARKELGPKGIRISKITEKNLSPLLLDLYHNPIYKENAVRIAHGMQTEARPEAVHDFIISG